MMRALVVLLVGCGGTAPATIANHEPPARLSCDVATVEHLRSVLCKRWHVPALDLRCAAGEFNTQGFFIAAQHGSLHRTGVVDASGAELVPFVDEPEPEFGTAINGYQTADLDGDGEDEIIESWRKSSPFALHPDSWLIVRVISNRRFHRIRGPYLARYHPDLGSCSSTWELRRHSIRIAVDVTPGIPPVDCLQAGLHTFALRGHALVDSNPRH